MSESFDSLTPADVGWNFSKYSSALDEAVDRCLKNEFRGTDFTPNCIAYDIIGLKYKKDDIVFLYNHLDQIPRIVGCLGHRSIRCVCGISVTQTDNIDDASVLEDHQNIEYSLNINDDVERDRYKSIIESIHPRRLKNVLDSRITSIEVRSYIASRII